MNALFIPLYDEGAEKVAAKWCGNLLVSAKEYGAFTTPPVMDTVD